MLRINGIHSDELGKGSEETEQNRKLQRNVGELVRRIDNLHQSANRVEDVFSEDLLGLRVRLREFALKLLHADPEKFGLKYLEIVWRKAWHEPVTLARQVGGASVGCVLLDSHLLSGLGQYHHLLLGLAEQYGWPPGLKLDLVSRLEFGFSGSKAKKYSGSKWMLDVVARCLVWLGDLSRYRLEFSENIERRRAETLAKKYYSACACIKPGFGLAYSQLAAISRDSNAGINPLFFYLKCVTSRERFDGGESNLRRLLDKSENEVNNLMDKPAAEVASAYLVQLVANLIDDRKEDEVIQACQQSLSSVHQAIAGGHRVESTWLARLTACVVLVIIKLGDGSAASSRTGLCHAWMLALTSHLAGMVVTGLGKGLWGEDWSETSISTEDTKTEEEEPEEEPDSKVEKKKRKKFVDLLRRRRVSNSGSSIDSDLSEDDEPPSISDDDFDSDESDDIYFSDSEEDDDVSGSDEDVVIESVEEELPDTRRVVEVVDQMGLLPALNLCFVWLRAQPQVLAGMGDGGNQLWTKLARLFTLLNLESDKYVKNDKISRIKAKNNAAPIDEEFYIRDTDMFENQLKEIEWSRNIVGGTVGETAARVSRVASWSWLVDRKECTIRWREGEGRAVIVETAQPEKKNVMKHMAELWLKRSHIFQAISAAHDDSPGLSGLLHADVPDRRPPLLDGRLGGAEATQSFDRLQAAIPVGVGAQRRDQGHARPSGPRADRLRCGARGGCQRERRHAGSLRPWHEAHRPEALPHR